MYIKLTEDPTQTCEQEKALWAGEGRPVIFCKTRQVLGEEPTVETLGGYPSPHPGGLDQQAPPWGQGLDRHS